MNAVEQKDSQTGLKRLGALFRKPNFLGAKDLNCYHPGQRASIVPGVGEGGSRKNVENRDR